MCTVCGCGPSDDHDHDHGHGPLGAAHAPGMDTRRIVQIETDILGHNNAHAARIRTTLADKGILALNLVSSPGSGKTTLLCRTAEMLAGRFPLAVIEGDQQTSNDADRIRATAAIQVNTGKGCHLDAHMVKPESGGWRRACERPRPPWKISRPPDVRSWGCCEHESAGGNARARRPRRDDGCRSDSVPPAPR